MAQDRSRLQALAKLRRANRLLLQATRARPTQAETAAAVDLAAQHGMTHAEIGNLLGYSSNHVAANRS